MPFDELINLIQEWPQDDRILLNSIPVPFFGEICKASVATIGINPSEHEFKKDHLPTAEKLGAMLNGSFTRRQAEEIICQRCKRYFQLKPYWAFFRPLEQIILGQHLTYHDGTLAHLDLLPWATTSRWSRVRERETLFDLPNAKQILDATLDEFKGGVLLANGRTVVDSLHHLTALNEPNGHQALIWAPIAGWNVTNWQYRGKRVIGWNHFRAYKNMPIEVKNYISTQAGDLL